MKGRDRQPAGIARSNYSTPCPGCRGRIVKGDTVTRVDLPDRAPAWWHTLCRKRAVAAIVEGEDR